MDWIKGGFRGGEASGAGCVQIRLLHLCMLCVTWCSDRGVLSQTWSWVLELLLSSSLPLQGRLAFPGISSQVACGFV